MNPMATEDVRGEDLEVVWLSSSRHSFAFASCSALITLPSLLFTSFACTLTSYTHFLCI